MDKSPERGASLGKMGIAPTRKNLLMPNELANRLRRKVAMGITCAMSLKEYLEKMVML